MESCCVVPTDLTEYCSAEGIKVVTHKDDPVVLSAETFQELGRREGPSEPSGFQKVVDSKYDESNGRI